MNASPPYGADPVADVILRSSDHVHFYVLGSLLRFVSPFFRDMFLINQGPAVDENEKKDGRPVIPLEEDSATLRLLLDLLYPCSQEPPLTDATLIWRVGKAAQKYIIDVIEDKLKNSIMSSSLLPLRIYAIAIDLGWDGVAIQAARKTLDTPLEELVYVEELRIIPGSGFYRFLEYRLRCDKSSNKLTEELMILPNNTAQSTDTEESNTASLSNADADPPFLSQHQFKATPKSDLVLRSSDFVDFYVIETVLRIVSEDFDTAFPLESRETSDGRTIIQVPEDGKTLHQLLSIIYYYVKELDVRDYQLYKGVVEAAQKYKMSIIEDKLREQLLASPLVQNDPLWIYILATDLRWEDVTKVAALNTLLKPLREMRYIGDLCRITGEDLFRLMRFRFRCADAAWSALQQNEIFQNCEPSQWSSHWRQDTVGYLDRRYNSRTSKKQYVPISSDEFKKKVKECPRGSTITEIYEAELKDMESVASKLTYEGDTCTLFYMLRWHNLGNLVEEVVSKVSLDTPSSDVR